MSGGMGDEAALLRERDAQATAALAAARAAAGEIEPPPVRGFTDHASPLWTRIYEERECN